MINIHGNYILYKSDDKGNQVIQLICCFFQHKY